MSLRRASAALLRLHVRRTAASVLPRERRPLTFAEEASAQLQALQALQAPTNDGRAAAPPLPPPPPAAPKPLDADRIDRARLQAARAADAAVAQLVAAHVSAATATTATAAALRQHLQNPPPFDYAPEELSEPAVVSPAAAVRSAAQTARAATAAVSAQQQAAEAQAAAAAEALALTKPDPAVELRKFYSHLGIETAAAATLETDEIYNKLVNYIMIGGQKDLARKLLNESLELVKIELLNAQREKTPAEGETSAPIQPVDPRAVLHQAAANTKPVMALSPVRRGGAVYQVPVPLSDKRRLALSLKWIVAAARSKSGAPFPKLLAREIVDASRNEGKAVAKKIEQHKMCEGNRAYVSMFTKKS